MTTMISTTIVLFAVFLRSAIAQSSSSAIDYCQALADVISICEIETASFTNLPASQQAGCVCGSTLGTMAWGPASFDGLAASCAIEYASVNPTVAADASELSGMCTSYAVQGPSVVASSRPTSTPYIAKTTPQASGNPAPSTTGGYFNVSPGSFPTTTFSPTTTYSVVMASQSSTTNAAPRMQRPGNGIMDLGIAIGGMAIGGYVMG